jgi:hypothetical protein
MRPGQKKVIHWGLFHRNWTFERAFLNSTF